MAKSKRMSDILASSTEKEITQRSKTPPYSSDGPTLPLLGDNIKNEIPSKQDQGKTEEQAPIIEQPVKSESPITPTVHPSLYTPWLLLPTELLKLLESQNRLRESHNIVPVVFTKNQNVKSGINRLKMYLGARLDAASSIPIPEALTQDDVLIAVSAQGDGTAKLVSIVDMMKRIVSPERGGVEGEVETWYMYLSLASVEVERKRKGSKREEDEPTLELGEVTHGGEGEPMEVDGAVDQDVAPRPDMVRVPVLTAWMTRMSIPSFRKAFDEQWFNVQKAPS